MTAEKQRVLNALEKEQKNIIATIHEGEKQMTQLSLMLDYLRKRHTDIISEMIRLGKSDIKDILNNGVKDL